MTTAYLEFLERKVRFNHASGVEVDLGDINPLLKPHQAALVHWACRGGRRAIFARFGLGKTVMQLEIQRLLRVHTGANLALIVCPLGVPLVIDPDRYVPASRLGRELVTLLAKEYRKKPPSWIPSD